MSFEKYIRPKMTRMVHRHWAVADAARSGVRSAAWVCPAPDRVLLFGHEDSFCEAGFASEACFCRRCSGEAVSEGIDSEGIFFLSGRECQDAGDISGPSVSGVSGTGAVGFSMGGGVKTPAVWLSGRRQVPFKVADHAFFHLFLIRCCIS